MAVETPHFDLPFRFGPDGHISVVDQDTVKDITNCVEAALRTTVGQREELPEFGVPDLTFAQQPLSLGETIERIMRNEPRATIIMEQHPDQFDRLVARVTALVTAREAENG